MEEATCDVLTADRGLLVADDNRAEDLTKEGMREGIAQSAAFILFLSKVSGLPVNTVVLIAYNF